MNHTSLFLSTDRGPASMGMAKEDVLYNLPPKHIHVFTSHPLVLKKSALIEDRMVLQSNNCNTELKTTSTRAFSLGHQNESIPCCERNGVLTCVNDVV